MLARERERNMNLGKVEYNGKEEFGFENLADQHSNAVSIVFVVVY